jgi:primosomal protein N' (replication factor Y)
MAPRISGGYQAVVITDGDTLFSQIDLRAHERAREAIFQATSLLSPQGKSLVVIDGSHPIVAALSRWNLGPLLTRELRERDQTQLPPYVHAISMEFEGSDASSFNSGIEAARTDGRVPPSTRVLGPTKIDGNRSRVVLTVSRRDGQLLIDFVGIYRKKRGASKKSIPAMRVDPYDLTHI